LGQKFSYLRLLVYPNNDRAIVKAEGDLHAMNGKNKHLGALRIPYLCTG